MPITLGLRAMVDGIALLAIASENGSEALTAERRKEPRRPRQHD